MGLRVGTAAIGLPVLLAAVWVGSPWLTLLIGAAAGLGTFELCRMARLVGREPPTLVAVVWSLGLIGVAHVLSSGLDSRDATRGLVAIVSVAFILWQFRRARSRVRWRDWGIAAGAALYPGGLLAHGVALRALDDGPEWVILALLVTFATDTAAFLVGSVVGRTPLAPTVSPGKTWEGAAGGLVAAVVASTALATLLGVGVGIGVAALLGILLGVAGQLGDLLESRVKRAAGAKESGWIVPGHGGVMDRLDSIVPNVALVYYYVIWVQ